jgi:hypothetical protein
MVGGLESFVEIIVEGFLGVSLVFGGGNQGEPSNR